MCALVTGVQTCALPISPRYLGPRREIRANDRREIVFGKAVQHSGGTAIRSIAWPSCSSHRSGPSSTMVDAASSTNAPRWTPSSPAAHTFFGILPSSTATSAGLTRSSADSAARSEEHTSDLQSLMRTPYAVLCLKKKQSEHHLRL